MVIWWLIPEASWLLIYKQIEGCDFTVFQFGDALRSVQKCPCFFLYKVSPCQFLYKWSLRPYKWFTGVRTLIIGFFHPIYDWIRGPPCSCFVSLLDNNDRSWLSKSPYPYSEVFRIGFDLFQAWLKGWYLAMLPTFQQCKTRLTPWKQTMSIKNEPWMK